MQIREMHTKFWLENQKERDHSGYLGIDGKIIYQEVLERTDLPTFLALFNNAV
jgi:hypothetical protein